MSITLIKVAEHIIFGSTRTSEEFNEMIKGQWEFRKGKTISDINGAVQKGLKLGRGKTEREIDCIAMYLETVLKKVKISVKENKDVN